MAKFYDNIDICILVKEAIGCGYPAVMLALGMQMHMALRGLKAYNTHPGYTVPSNGIIAGCTQSTYYAKVYLGKIMDHYYLTWCHEQMIHERHLRGFIDDIRISVRAKGDTLS